MKLPWLFMSLRHEHVGQPHAARRPEIEELVLRDLRRERPVPVLAPLRQQLVEADGIDHRTGQDMGADFGALFDDHDGDLAALLGSVLLEPDRCGETCWTGTDDDDVEFHRFTGGQIHRCSPEDDPTGCRFDPRPCEEAQPNPLPIRF